MKTISRCVIASLALLVWSACCAPSWAQRTANIDARGYTNIDAAQEVVELWSTERQLFVKGNIGVSEKQLRDLADWLAKEGPHWTVVLMEDATGEAFVAADRRSYVGMDAVEFALGKGLSNRTGFGALLHPTTGETDGAIFVLFLKERKFSYFSSEAQDRRGLGRSHWIGELDQPAFRAMRAGGRIVDAVKDTVKSINQRLDRAIAKEAESARQAELERLRDLQTAQESVAHLRDVLAQVDAEQQSLLSQFPGATGELAAPPLDEWKRELSLREGALTPENASQSLQPLKQLGTQIDSYLNGYAAIRGFETNRKEIEGEAVRLAGAPNGVANDVVQEARNLVQAAEKKARNGDMDVTQVLKQAEEQLMDGRTLWSDEQQRIDAAAARGKLIRQVLFGIGGGLLVLGAGLLVFLNRRRQAAMDRAWKTVREREASVAQETDGLDQIFAQSADLLGSRNRIEERGYTGATRDLSLQALSDIDDLFIMTKEIRRVLRESRQLVEPKDLWAQVVNAFSPDRYEETVRHISGKPLKFTRATGIPMALMDLVRQRAKETGQPEPNEIPDELILTFDEIYSAIQSRRQRARDSILKLEDCLTRVNEELNRLQTEAQSALDQEMALSNAAEDGFFSVPSYFDDLIPAVQKDLSEAESMMASDAVTAMEGPIARASRMLTQARQLGQSLLAFRTSGLQEMLEGSSKLKGMGYPTDWMDLELRQRSQRANGLFLQATTESIEEGHRDWNASMEQLLVSVREAVQLAEQIRDPAAPRLDQLQREIQGARSELSHRLGISENQILVEPNLNPDDAVVAARKNLEAAVTLLRQGKIEACRAALQGFDAEIQRGVQTIDATRNSVQTLESQLADQRARLQEAMHRNQQLWTTVQDAEQQYSVDALRLAYTSAGASHPDWSAPSEAPPMTPDSRTTDSRIASHGDIEQGSSRASQLLEQSQSLADTCHTMHDGALSRYRQGMVLTAMDQLEQSANVLIQMNMRLDRVEAHLKQLEQTVVENRQSLAHCTASVERLLDAQRDRMVTIPTIEQIQATAAQMEPLQNLVGARHQDNNPFDLTQRLMAFQKRIAELDGMVVSDRHGFAEANRALEGAVQQWRVASQYVKQSRADEIPDSPATRESVQRVDALEKILLNIQSDFSQDHGDWQAIGQRSASLQSELATVSQQLQKELTLANEALEVFQQASQSVYNAEHWTGPWGLRIQDSPGVHQLDSARAALQRGQYRSVLDLSRQAEQAASLAIQRAEREVAARKMEEQQRAERIRRERMAAEAARYGGVIVGTGLGRSSGPSIFGPGGFGSSSGGFGGGGFGGGSGGFGGGTGGTSGGGSSSNDTSSGFGRSGW